MMQIRPYEARTQYSQPSPFEPIVPQLIISKVIQLDDIMVWFLTQGLSFHQGNKVSSCKCPVKHSLETVEVTP